MKTKVIKPYCILWRIKPELKPAHLDWSILESFHDKLQRDTKLDALKRSRNLLDFKAGSWKEIENLNNLNKPSIIQLNQINHEQTNLTN